MKNSVETLNQHQQPLKKETAFSNLARNICNVSIKIIKARLVTTLPNHYYFLIIFLNCPQSYKTRGLKQEAKTIIIILPFIIIF